MPLQRTDIQKFEQRNFRPAGKNHQRDESAKKPAKPGESVAAEQLGPWIGEKLVRTFENVIQPCPNQTCESRDSDDQKSFVFFVSGGNALELRSGGD